MHGFVGRRGELGMLRARLAAARTGAPQVVEIQGPPGIGKTALVAAFLADPGGDVPPRVLRAGGEETESLLAYGVLDQLARSAGPAGGGGVGSRGPPSGGLGGAVPWGLRPP